MDSQNMRKVKKDDSMEDKLEIKISSQFSNIPKGREHPKDGPNTGQRFRDEFLTPNFHKYKKIIIDLDDLYGCPSSFREESFGGLARIFGISETLDKLEFICTDQPPLKDLILSDIVNAKK